MRKPVRSTVANRKYFQGGGLAPMKPAAPEEAVGIMASSQPLVDMVAQNAGNPQGGMSPLNFNQGGSVFLRQANQVPTESSILNFNQRDLKKRLVPTLDIPKRKPGFSIDVPETGSRLEKILKTKINLPSLLPGALSGVPSQILGTKVNLPLRSPFKGIAQYFGSDPADEGGIASRFPTASSSQLATLDALAQMNPNNKDEIYSLGEKIITDDKSEATGEDLANLMKSEKLMLDKKADDELDRIQKEANEQARKEAEGKAPEIDPITDKQKKDSEELIEKEKSKTSVVKKSEDDETIDNVENITGSEEKKDPTQDPVKQGEEPKTAMDETIQNINKNAEEGNQEATTKSIEDYTEEFKKAMPKFEGMTEEEKGMAILEAGLAIMGGQSSRALENISNGLQPLVKKFAKNKEQERAFNQQINIAAAKYGIERTNSMLEREMDFEMKERNLIQIYNPKTDETKSITQADVRAGKVPDGFFITADPLKSKIDSINATANLLAKEAKLAKETADLVKEQKEATEAGEFDVYKGQKINVAYREQAYQLLNAQESKQLLGPVLENILSDEGKKMVGLEGAFATGLDQVLNAVGLQKGDETLARRKGIRGRAENIAEYRTRVGIVLNRKISSLLGEGGKTVSDNDRRLAKEIGGLWATYLSDSVFGQGANISSLRTKVTELYKTIQNDERRAIAAMKQIESDVGRLRVPGTDTTKAEQFADVRSNIFATTSGITGNVINMDDVYDYEKNDFKEQVKI